MPTLTIRSGKAGEAWLRNALSADSQVPISKIIELAIQYHDTTGEYIHLGTVSLKEENPQRIQKRIYFRDNSPVPDILKREREQHHRLPKDVISEVLLGGLEPADETRYLSADEYAKALFLLSKKAVPTSILKKAQLKEEKLDVVSDKENVSAKDKKKTKKTERIQYAGPFIASFDEK